MRLTVAQALVRFLAAQEVERDGERHRFFAGCWGIFGHGNVAGLGQALQQHGDLLPFHQARNEQAMVHVAAGYARQLNRLGAGDAFGGALVHGLLHGWDLERTIRLANAAGAYVAGRLACADAMPALEDLQPMLTEEVRS